MGILQPSAILEPSSTRAFTPKNAQWISLALFIFALLIGAFLRFHQIEIKPFHSDEGGNTSFVLDLYRDGRYAYDPVNYHGPTLYYFALISVYLLGVTDLAMRSWPAIWGILSVAIVWPLRRWLGWAGTPVAALFVAISPGLVYFSRDFIHEMSFGFFTLAMAVSGCLYIVERRFLYMAGFAVSTGLLFATKETALIHLIVLILAALCAALWDINQRLPGRKRLQLGAAWSQLRRELNSLRPPADHLVAAAIIFLAVNVLFYSSFFTHWRGVPDAVKSVLLWTQRGTRGHEHDHPFNYFFGLLIKFELMLVIGAVLGGILAVVRSNRFALFLAAWALGITLAYSFIPYKTPWLVVTMLLPCALLCGYAAQDLFDMTRSLPQRTLAVLAVSIALIPLLGKAARISFFEHDDNNNENGFLMGLGTKLGLTAYTEIQCGGYVYSQTDRDTFSLVEEITKAADRLPLGRHTDILITAPDYWPLPWYLRDLHDVRFDGKVPSEIPQPIVVASVDQRAEIEPLLPPHTQAQQFVLRPSVDLMLYYPEENPLPAPSDAGVLPGDRGTQADQAR